jgi:hypothetical protein
MRRSARRRARPRQEAPDVPAGRVFSMWPSHVCRLRRPRRAGARERAPGREVPLSRGEAKGSGSRGPSHAPAALVASRTPREIAHETFSGRLARTGHGQLARTPRLSRDLDRAPDLGAAPARGAYLNGAVTAPVGATRRRRGRSETEVGVGMTIADHPSTDPDVRHYRIRLLPWVTNARRWEGQGWQMRAGGSQQSR